LYVLEFLKNIYSAIQHDLKIYIDSNFTKKIRPNQRKETLLKKIKFYSLQKKLQLKQISPLEFVEKICDFKFEKKIKECVKSEVDERNINEEDQNSDFIDTNSNETCNYF
jgi:hypothetical protein